MSFTARDIRRSMDVYTLDNVYLGTVLAVRPVAEEPHDPDELVPAASRQSSEVSGELLGPAPTGPIGNPGPRNQSAESWFAVRGGARPLGRGSIAVGRWWGLRGRWTIPVDGIQSVSLERVVLGLTKNELPQIEAKPRGS